MAWLCACHKRNELLLTRTVICRWCIMYWFRSDGFDIPPACAFRSLKWKHQWMLVHGFNSRRSGCKQHKYISRFSFTIWLFRPDVPLRKQTSISITSSKYSVRKKRLHHKTKAKPERVEWTCTKKGFSIEMLSVIQFGLIGSSDRSRVELSFDFLSTPYISSPIAQHEWEHIYYIVYLFANTILSPLGIILSVLNPYELLF